MLKIVGLILIITASTLFGFFLSVKLKNRRLRLLKLCTFLEELEMQIKSGAELKNILLASGGDVGIYIEDFGGVRIEDLVCVKSDGYENFTTSKKELTEL